MSSADEAIAHIDQTELVNFALTICNIDSVFRAVSVGLALFLFVPLAHSADRVRIAVTNYNMSFLGAGVALHRGFFKQEGLEAEIIRMNANVAVAALVSGDIGYTMIFGSIVRAAVRGLPVRVNASFIDGSTHALLARPEFVSVKELKGKTLGIQAHGASDHLAALTMLRYHGINPEKDIKIVALGPASARFAALKEGVVDVVVISPPGDAEGVKMGFRVLSRAYEVFKFPFVGMGTNVRKLQEHPEEVKKVLKAMISANRYIREQREGTVNTLVQWGRVDPAHAYASYDSTVKAFNADGSIPESGLRQVIEQAQKELGVTRQVPLDEVWDLAPLREAQKELGIKGK
jgi:NitT/TauT family transport system substrate-binding protein